jgi:branched-chain amino acid transport system substrate-binding protein
MTGRGLAQGVRSPIRWSCTVALVVVLAVALAACGGDDEAASTTAAPATPTETAPPATETAPSATTETAPPATETVATTGEQTGQSSVTDYVEYTGGSAGPADPSLTPVVIGWVNQQGGPIEIGATATDGARLGVQYVNEHLGGVGGHPVELKECFIAQAEEEGQRCAQEMSNDDALSVINMGAVAVGNQTFHATLGGAKPVIVGVSGSPADITQENAGLLYGDVLYVLAPLATYSRDVLGAKSAALIFPDVAGVQYAADVTAQAFEQAGIEVTKVGFPPEASDLVAPLTAAGAQEADVLVPIITPADCVKTAKTIEQLGLEAPVLATPLCLNPATREGLGDFPLWTYLIASSLTTDTTDPAVPPYQAVLTEYGQEAFIGEPWFMLGFAQVLTTVKFLNAIGVDNITPEAVLGQLKAFQGPLVLGPPEIQCGKYPEAPAVCNDLAQFYEYEGQGKFTGGGSWIGPPGATN